MDNSRRATAQATTKEATRGTTKELPFTSQLIRLLLFANAAVLCATALVATLYEVVSAESQLVDHARTQAELFSPNLHTPLMLRQAKDAREVLAALALEPRIRTACVYGGDRSELARYSRPVGYDDQVNHEDDGRGTCPRLTADSKNHLAHGSLAFFHRLVAQEGATGTLFLRYDMPSFAHRMGSYLPLLGSVLLALLTLSALVFAFVHRVVGEPLYQLVEATKHAADKEEWSTRIQTGNSGDIGHLATAFNRLLSTLQQRDATIRQAHREHSALQEQLVQTQKTESIGRLVGGVAHDFNNLLTVMAGCTELLRYQYAENNAANNAARPLLQNIQEATRQATDLTHRLLAFARRQIIGPRVLSFNEVVLDAEKMLRSMISEDIEVVVIPRPDLWLVKADPGQIMQVLVNLVINARDAMPQGGTLTIETQNQVLTAQDVAHRDDVAPGDYATLIVRDTGTGLSEEAQTRLFEPFFTTKERGKGTGLGLAMCYGILKQSGGHIEFSSELNHGTRFEIFLRRDPAAQEIPKPKTFPLHLPSGEETILVVEDAALVRVTTTELLRAQGYKVLEAASGADALDLVKNTREDIHLLLTDVVMPEMSGPDVARQITALRPNIRVLYVSGYTAREIGHRSELDPGIAFLQKPFTSETLIRKVRQTIDT